MIKRVTAFITGAVLCLSVIFGSALFANAQSGYLITDSGVKYGDVNADDSIDILDLLTIRKYLAKWDVTLNEDASDVNCDGITDILDLLMIRKYLAKWDIMLGEPNDTTEPASTAAESSAAVTTAPTAPSASPSTTEPEWSDRY